MKKLFATPNRVFLYLLQARLEDKGIQTLFKNQDVAGQAAGELPPAVVTPELWIMHDDDLVVAQKILQEELAQQSKPNQPWICTNCHEKLEGQFDVCWNCGQSKA